MPSLVQVLLPLADNGGRRISHAAYTQVRNELAQRYGGVTAYTQSPAEGQWIARGKKIHDDIIVVEVMVKRVERAWWARYRKTLEARFRQRSIVVRAHQIELL